MIVYLGVLIELLKEWKLSLTLLLPFVTPFLLLGCLNMRGCALSYYNLISYVWFISLRGLPNSKWNGEVDLGERDVSGGTGRRGGREIVVKMQYMRED